VVLFHPTTIAANGSKLHFGSTKSQQIKKTKTRINKKGKSKLIKPANHQCAGLRKGVMQAIRKIQIITKFVMKKNRLVKVRKERRMR